MTARLRRHLPRRPLWIAALCAGCGASDAVGPVDDPLPPPSDPLPGTGLVRWSPDRTDAGRVFEASAPLQLELHVPPGVVVRGLGAPAPTVDASGAPVPMALQTVDGSVVQIELPTSPYGTTDEQALTSSALFDKPWSCGVRVRTCTTDPGERGRWRAYRLRTVGGRVRARELQIAPITEGWGTTADAAPRMLPLWLDPADPPLDDQDRIRLVYTGRVPLRSTTWLTDRPFRVHVRYRTGSDDTAVPCDPLDPACWTVVDAADVDGLDLDPGPPAFVDVRTPMDVVVGRPFGVDVVVLDRWKNPTPITGTLRLRFDDGTAVSTLRLVDAWKGRATATVTAAGPFSVRVRPPPGVDDVHQWSYAWPDGERTWRRLLGDVHVHTGGDGTNAFLYGWTFGDHHGQYIRDDESLQFLQDVSGYDFGALSEHASSEGSYVAPPAPSPFAPGGPCAIDGQSEPGLAGWWEASQAASRVYQDAHPDFVTFPAYEWHGRWKQGATDAKLHRVVLFRDHDTATPYGLPMLPGNTNLRPPACLFRWIEDHGLTPADVLVLPHMMEPGPQNTDWDLTYDPPAPYDTLVDAAAPQRWQRVGEVFSSRAYNGRNGTGADRLSAFEGQAADPRLEPWTFRYGWQDTRALIGLVGAGDGHHGKPGMNDHWASDGSLPDISHDPVGTAVVLADATTPSPRDGIFDAFGARRTYATSGIRAWLAFDVGDGATTWPMGSEVGAVSACGLTAHVGLAVGQSVRELTVWGAPVGQPVGYVPVGQWVGLNRERVDSDLPLTNPLDPSATDGARWLYYVRAYVGPDVPPGQSAADRAAGHRDAVWSSPIWVDWQPPSACP
ncbi:MAG: DUF3604 domain-containing protein [Alphaproteobacteria bacterium]|nr:DUF3604 domain-containing protein [Alphaproteobacteria bacterium]